MSNESAFTGTIKGGKDFDAPWVVVRGDSEQEYESRLLALESGGSLATMGRLTTMFAAQYNLGKGLGARAVDAPVNSQPTVEQNAVDPNWGAPQQSPAPSYGGGYGAPAAAPSAPAGGRPGVPMILGREAKWIDKGTWKAWADPRSQGETAHLTEKTDNPSHPGLAGGTHKFWAFVR